MTAEVKSRIAILRDRVKVAEDARVPTYDVPFRGKAIPLRKLQVKTDFPLYRVVSGRTRRAQSQYLDEHPALPQGFFADPEDPNVQIAQHQILLRMIGEMELDTDLAEKGQRAPLILTSDGYVVDGNRRLAALRQDNAEYVDAVVLPEDAESHEIYETELELQMQRETKARYNWMDQSLHLEYGIKELNESREILAKRMRLSIDEIDQELSKLNLVRLYLDWLGQPGKYHKVPSDRAGSMEQAFQDLAQRLASAPMLRRHESERRMIRNACFAAIHREAGYKEVRNLIRQLSQNPQKVLDRLKEREPDLATSAGSADARREISPSSGPPDPLLAIVEEASSAADPAVEQLLAIVSDPTKTEKAGPILLEIVQDLEAEAKDAKQAHVPLKLVQHAVSDLEKVDLDAQTEGLDSIARALSDVFTQAERLREQIEKLRAGM